MPHQHIFKLSIVVLGQRPMVPLKGDISPPDGQDASQRVRGSGRPDRGSRNQPGGLRGQLEGLGASQKI